MEKRIRILVAKPGLDGHDRGAKVVAQALRDAGMEVIYTGLHQTVDQIVNIALQEDVDVIGLSIMSGAHLPICEKLMIKMKDKNIDECYLSAGGVSPVPLFLRKTGEFFSGKPVTSEIIMQANTVMQEEISPISDVRGSAEYKRLLLRQLLVAHFFRLFPGRLNISIYKL